MIPFREVLAEHHASTEQMLITDLPLFLDNDPDIEALAEALALVRAVRGFWQDAEKFIVAAVVQEMPTDVMAVNGYMLERRGGHKRARWDHPAIASHLAEIANVERVDPTTGEVREDLGPAVVRLILSAAGIGYWRTSVLKRHGIDPGKYSEWEEIPPTVHIRAVGESA